MAADYRILHFIANPVAGLRVPVALLVRDEGGELEVVPNPAPPSAACLGDPHAAHAIHLAMPQVERLRDFDRLPDRMGPQFVLSEVQRVEEEDACGRLRSAVFPRYAEDDAVPKPRRTSRRKAGRRWLEHRHVWHIVKEQYRPKDAHQIEAISHYAMGRESLLLMEPLTATKSPEQVRNDTSRVVTRLLAHASSVGHEHPPRLIAYFLPGRYDGLQEKVRSDLGERAEVVDCGIAEQESRFLAAIRATGSGDDLLDLLAYDA